MHKAENMDVLTQLSIKMSKWVFDVILPHRATFRIDARLAWQKAKLEYQTVKLDNPLFLVCVSRLLVRASARQTWFINYPH
jgi:hypothetical protein